MEYRRFPHGNENETLSALGLGMGGIGKTPVHYADLQTFSV